MSAILFFIFASCGPLNVFRCTLSTAKKALFHIFFVHACVHQYIWVPPMGFYSGGCCEINIFFFSILRGYSTPGPYFYRLCALSQEIKQFCTKFHMDLIRNVPRNSKITVLFQYRLLLWSYSKKCVKINIFHFLIHINQKPLDLLNSSVVIRFLGMLPIRDISYLSPMCCNF